ncbi:MAG: hypothetical protein FJ100_22215 [Deltaproteobacteria bacterium]|nr:hypothetical protein [Deltaproteobacteria bacterium]
MPATSTTTDRVYVYLGRPALRWAAWACVLVCAACLPGKRDNTALDSATSKADIASGDLGKVKTVDTAIDGPPRDGLDSADAPQDVAAEVAPDAVVAEIAVDTPVALGGCTTDTQCNSLPFGPCAIGVCNLDNGLCFAKDLPDDAACAGDKCTAKAKCAAGKCGGTPLACNDGNACTIDACDPGLGCGHVALHGLACDDGFKCTENDFCTAGVCIGKAKNCDDGNVCSHDVCDPATGACAALALPKDNTVVCGNGDKPCQSPGKCDATKNCVTKNKCDDGNPCTDDLCGAGEDCLHLGKTTPCTPAGASDDPCKPGVCTWPADGVGLPTCVTKVKCEDKLCNQTGCNKTGLCSYTKLETGPCDDGDPCTADSTCAKGQCKAGATLSCDDGNPCTSESCTAELGCVAKPVATAASCNDGDGCTSEDVCSAGKCAGKPIACDDGNACTKDTCDPATGCKHDAGEDGATCPGGACKGGQCVK